MRCVTKLTCLFSLAVFIGTADAVPFSNGGFDDYISPPNTSPINNQTPISWIGSSNDAQIDNVQGVITAPHSGTRFFEFKTNNPSYVYQSFDTLTGATYEVQLFAARPNLNAGRINQFDVDIFSTGGDPGSGTDGDLLDETILNAQVPSGTFVPFVFQWDATSAESTLRFLDGGTTGIDPAIDTVSITLISGNQIPEPTTAVLALVGCAGFMRRRRRLA